MTGDNHTFLILNSRFAAKYFSENFNIKIYKSGFEQIAS